MLGAARARSATCRSSVEVLLGKGAMPLRQLVAARARRRRCGSIGGRRRPRRPRHRRADGARRSRDHRGLGGGARHPRPRAERRGRFVSDCPCWRGRGRARSPTASCGAACSRSSWCSALLGGAGLGGAPRPPRLLHHVSRRSVRVEATVPLGERRSLMVVAIEGRRLLLGLTPMQVSLVTELTRRAVRRRAGARRAARRSADVDHAHTMIRRLADHRRRAAPDSRARLGPAGRPPRRRRWTCPSRASATSRRRCRSSCC